MKTPSFSLRQEDLVLTDPGGLADRLAEFLRAYLQPDETDRDLVLLFVDRLFLGLCEDFEDEELMRGVELQFSALSKDQVESLRAMQARFRQSQTITVAATAGQ